MGTRLSASLSTYRRKEGKPFLDRMSFVIHSTESKEGKQELSHQRDGTMILFPFDV